MYRTGCPELAIDFRVPAGHAFLTHVNAVLRALVGRLTVRMFATISHFAVVLIALYT